jgi:glycosyltransferase involved in cell wall biosynthesis
MERREMPSQLKPSVFVGMPCYDSVKRETVMALLKLFDKFRSSAIKAQFRTINSSLVTHGRNMVTCGFLHSKYDYLLFIDADVSFEPEAVLRMLVAKKDVICTPYRLKLADMTVKYPVTFKDAKKIDIEELGMVDIVEIEAGPAGLMLIDRKVFERLMKKNSNYKIKIPDNKLKEMNDEVMGVPTTEDPISEYLYNFWDTSFYLSSGAWKGEDLAFCALVRGAGFRIHANIDSETTHHGTHSWKGRFKEVLR